MIQPLFRRRHMLVSALAAGFALAVRPISAQTIRTDSTGLMAGEVSIPVEGGTMPAYRAMPATGTNFPTVLVVQEIFGVHEYIQDVCRRLARLGYLAIAPELFARQGDVSQLADIAAIRQVVARVPDAQVLADLDATARWAAQAGGGDADKLGITGFCWGGRIVWLYAAHNSNLKAGVAWYGRLTNPATELQPRHPLDVATELKAPVLGLYGEKDDGIPLSSVEDMRRRLPANSPSKIIVYPEAPHGFHADYRPSFRRDAAEDGWQQLQTWFRQYGVA